MQVITDTQDALLFTLHVVWAANNGGLWCDREWKLLCGLQVGKRTCGERAGSVAELPCIHAVSNDAALDDCHCCVE